MSLKFGSRSIIALGLAVISNYPIMLRADVISDGKSNFVCSIRYLCEKFGSDAQDCAPSGNFNQCMSIKLGADANSILSTACNTDGSLKQELIWGLQSRGVEDQTLGMADVNCYIAYADLSAAETFGYRPTLFDSMIAWKDSLDYMTTPFIYSSLIALTDMTK